MTSHFFSTVYKVASHIPKGKVATYKDIAYLAGNPNASRAVGMAMKCNPDTKIVPCHRVVGSDGNMHGYAMGGEAVKMHMLKEEGVTFIGKRVDLQKSRWSPPSDKKLI